MREGTERKRGPLPIWRRVGRGMFIGRSIRVTVMACTKSQVVLGVEAPLAVVVSPHGVTMEQHLTLQIDRETRTDGKPRDLVTVVLAVDESVRIGREATITYTGQDMSDRASLSIDAPLNVAVTRDDFTFEEHMRIQERREGGRR